VRARSELRTASGAPFWLLRNGLVDVGESPVPSRADVVVVGAGITGALLADRFVRDGRQVLVLERNAPGEGSTSVSTALLQYELDVELVSLAGMLGEENAARAYRRCSDAINELETLAHSLDDNGDFRRATSVYVGTKRGDAKRLRREMELRTKHGIQSRLVSRDELGERYGLRAHAALETDQAANVDPVRLARSVLKRAVLGGATVCARTALVNWSLDADRIMVTTARGTCSAGAIVFATGYELPEGVPENRVSLLSSYALVTQPAADLGPLEGGAMIWETARPYTYLRSTPDRRILVGGVDVPFKNTDARDALLPVRTRQLERYLKNVFGESLPATAFAWAGTFGETGDGLPLIGRLPNYTNAYAALGYGGNGIVFSQIAADLLGALCAGQGHEDERLFGFDR